MQKKKKKMDWDNYLTPHTDINSKGIKDFKGRPEIIKLEESIGSMLSDIILSNIFQDMPPQARETKAKINKWNYIKLKKHYTGNNQQNKKTSG